MSVQYPDFTRLKQKVADTSSAANVVVNAFNNMSAAASRAQQLALNREKMNADIANSNARLNLDKQKTAAYISAQKATEARAALKLKMEQAKQKAYEEALTEKKADKLKIENEKKAAVDRELAVLSSPYGENILNEPKNKIIKEDITVDDTAVSPVAASRLKEILEKDPQKYKPKKLENITDDEQDLILAVNTIKNQIKDPLKQELAIAKLANSVGMLDEEKNTSSSAAINRKLLKIKNNLFPKSGERLRMWGGEGYFSDNQADQNKKETLIDRLQQKIKKEDAIKEGESELKVVKPLDRFNDSLNKIKNKINKNKQIQKYNKSVFENQDNITKSLARPIKIVVGKNNKTVQMKRSTYVNNINRDKEKAINKVLTNNDIDKKAKILAIKKINIAYKNALNDFDKELVSQIDRTRKRSDIIFKAKIDVEKQKEINKQTEKNNERLAVIKQRLNNTLTPAKRRMLRLEEEKLILDNKKKRRELKN